jgi:hypothetical protein
MKIILSKKLTAKSVFDKKTAKRLINGFIVLPLSEPGYEGSFIY